MIALQRSLKRLEQISDLDRNPEPQLSQRSIVDPSLYPLHFGLTKYYSDPMSSFTDCIRLSGKGMSRDRISPKENGILDERHSYKIDNAFSLRYQWLPCDIRFEEETGKAKCASSCTSHLAARGSDQTAELQVTSTTCTRYMIKRSMQSPISCLLLLYLCSTVH